MSALGGGEPEVDWVDNSPDKTPLRPDSLLHVGSWIEYADGLEAVVVRLQEALSRYINSLDVRGPSEPETADALAELRRLVVSPDKPPEPERLDTDVWPDNAFGRAVGGEQE